MQANIKISIVSYLNSKPFLYGLKKYETDLKSTILLDNPTECASKLISGEAQIGLIPIAMIDRVPNAQIISDYCIGCNGLVDSVCLYSNVPYKKITKIKLDSESKTSVQLLKIIAAQYWKINPIYVSEIDCNTTVEAELAIGDKAFDKKQQYKYYYDLGEEWKNFTNLPFVFACWVSNVALPPTFIQLFNEALSQMNNNITTIIDLFELKKNYPIVDVEDYLNNKIKFVLTDEMKQGMKLFLEKLFFLEEQATPLVIPIEYR